MLIKNLIEGKKYIFVNATDQVAEAATYEGFDQDSETHKFKIEGGSDEFSNYHFLEHTQLEIRNLYEFKYDFKYVDPIHKKISNLLKNKKGVVGIDDWSLVKTVLLHNNIKYKIEHYSKEYHDYTVVLL